MSPFVYLIAEGVTDVALITRVLRLYFPMTRVKRREDLPERAREWLDGFKWPVRGDITRLAVPAPVFLKTERSLVAIRNAQGLSQMEACGCEQSPALYDGSPAQAWQEPQDQLG